jgi:hypothetical protein
MLCRETAKEVDDKPTVVHIGRTIPGNKETTMKNLEKLMAAIALCALLATWAVTIAPAATHEAPSGETAADYATDGPVAQFWTVEDFIHYE